MLRWLIRNRRWFCWVASPDRLMLVLISGLVCLEFCAAGSTNRLLAAPTDQETSLTAKLFPAVDAKDVCPDTPLRITFVSIPVVGAGKIEVLDAADGTVVESIDVSVPTRSKTIGGVPNFNYRPVI